MGVFSPPTSVDIALRAGFTGNGDSGLGSLPTAAAAEMIGGEGGDGGDLRPTVSAACRRPLVERRALRPMPTADTARFQRLELGLRVGTLGTLQSLSSSILALASIVALVVAVALGSSRTSGTDTTSTQALSVHCLWTLFRPWRLRRRCPLESLPSLSNSRYTSSRNRISSSTSW